MRTLHANVRDLVFSCVVKGLYHSAPISCAENDPNCLGRRQRLVYETKARQWGWWQLLAEAAVQSQIGERRILVGSRQSLLGQLSVR